LGFQFHDHWLAFPQRPPPPVPPVKSASGKALELAVYQSTPVVLARPASRVPCGPRYQVRATVPGTGNVRKEASNPAYGSPAWPFMSGPAPAPLSKSTRTDGSASNAASAESYGIVHSGSGGIVMTLLCGSPIACW
jgi:hypothetical protein